MTTHPRRVARTPAVAFIRLALIFSSVPAAAQQARPSILAIDTVAAIDYASDFDGDRSTGVILDSVVSAGIGRGFEAIVRPYVQRLGSGEWNRQIWIAALRYEHRGAVRIRVDGGLIPSPIGLANLTLRPHLNPTIAQPSSLFTALPSLDARAPRTTLLGALYPYGGQVTVSGSRWDSRVALIDTSPLRSRRVFAAANPPRFATVVAGAGVTPVVGWRTGVTVARGGWLRAGENPAATDDRDATVVALETEFSVAYTKLAGEWVRDSVETSLGTRVASGWFVHGHHTLAPRWFVAARVERMSAPVLPPLVDKERFLGTEEILGFRATPDITLRIGHRGRRLFGRPEFDHQGTVSIVWWRRWI